MALLSWWKVDNIVIIVVAVVLERLMNENTLDLIFIGHVQICVAP